MPLELEEYNRIKNEILRSVIGHIPIEIREDWSIALLGDVYKSLGAAFDSGYLIGLEKVHV